MRYSELRQMHSNLKQSFENLPPFPQKKFISTTNPAFLNERMIQLNVYLCILLNEEEYHKNGQLFNSLQQYATKYVNPKIWEINAATLYRCNYDQWQAESCGNFIQMTDGDSKGFTVYRFNIFENENKRGQIEKRFKEFVKLHEFIEQKFSNVIENLPSLPPKISNFNTNIPKEKRQCDLQEYLNKLFKINGIESCYFFRQFFQNVSQPLETLQVSSPPQNIHQQSLNNPEQKIVIEDDLFIKDPFEDSTGQGERIGHLNSLQIDELQQYAGQISPTNNQP